jgi:hypothetical protein
MNRETHVRLCERLGAKFPGPTRRSVGDCRPYADQISISLADPVGGVLTEMAMFSTVEVTVRCITFLGYMSRLLDI